ncbi:Gfo/Idh/MocA family oxidoreductase [Marispirochaeta sp.]|jgi:predicted dehydrogenase|uniref:Gfo/Idh/MocA family protein n=1 Tax=Marispirochaeta sp. TaxID=2038653 RepID=UPI0029C962F3|nr:Gfo/Idh/MocA family oxidoreductase [Marispirochaeta sp.]
MGKIGVGIVGVGKISGIYLQNLTTIFSDKVSVVAVSDLIQERAAEAAQEYGIPEAVSVDELMASPDVEIVLNLTTPDSHFDICLRAVEAGKHVYVEKPLCIARDDATKLLRTAAEKKVRIGGAPDTFLGAGIQTSRKIIDDGWIGTPIGAAAFMMNHGHEHWHPAPEFYYKPGAGPMFDMGPYYLTALVNLLGPVKSLCGSVKKSFDERTISSEPLKGNKIQVEVPTHVVGIMNFASGVIGTIVTSFDVWSHSMPWIEVYGTEGTLRVPDPNTFGGPVLLKRFRSEEWSEIPLYYPYQENSRGLGVAEMAEAIEAGRPHRVSGELTNHILELMHGFHDAAASKGSYSVTSTCSRPEAMVSG